MSETPKQHFPSDPPLPSSVAEENKPSPTYHSPAPWKLFPADPAEFQTVWSEVRAREGMVIAYLAYDFQPGITSPEFADAALIVAAPRLLRALLDLHPDFRPTPAERAPEFLAEANERARQLLRNLQEGGVF